MGAHLSESGGVPSPSPCNGGGLEQAEAARRLTEFGFNEPSTVARTSAVRELLRRFSSPLVAILLLAGIVSAVVRDFVNAAIVLGIVLVSVVVEFAQTRRSQQAADSLKARVAQTATVRRDGRFVEIHRRLVVPGDVVRLDAGDLVPADGSCSRVKTSI